MCPLRALVITLLARRIAFPTRTLGIVLLSVMLGFGSMAQQADKTREPSSANVKWDCCESARGSFQRRVGNSGCKSSS
jgi:hypothetical protein